MQRRTMTGTNNTLQGEGLGNLFIKLGKTANKATKKLATNLMKNPGRGLEIEKNGTAAVSKNPKGAYSTNPVVRYFDLNGRGFYFGKFVYIFCCVIA